MDEPAESATRLREELNALGVQAQQVDLPGVSILSIYARLVVWCRGDAFQWAGEPEPYTHPVDDPAGAASRIAERFRELRNRRRR
ncbi:MAG: hypothetical protein GEV03_25885 [Streptosporangiales bacterium]|nr:hypothetical protein [Streptosporangiales bacterium]